MEQQNRPKVGTGVFIINNENQLLFLLRKGSHGEGSWCIPGGHLEFGESFLDSAKREVKEETGLKIKDIEVVGVTNDLFAKEKKHYVTIFMKALGWQGTPKIMEAEKCTKMGWFDLNNLPSPLFVSDINFFKSDTFCLCGSGKKYKRCHGS
jgi:8-oxo-dGTP diphosphatase